MPRSRIDGKLTGIRMPHTLLREVDALAGPGRMAEFVRAAVEAEVARRKSEGREGARPPGPSSPEAPPGYSPNSSPTPWGAAPDKWSGYGIAGSAMAVEMRWTLPPVAPASAPTPAPAPAGRKIKRGGRVRSPRHKPGRRVSDHPAHSAWASMRQQSRVSGQPIVREWEDFWVFERDMGSKPPDAILMRRDPGQGWSPDNCTWGTKAEVIARRPTTRFYTFNGQTLTLTGWAKETNINVGVLRARARAGWPIDEMLGTPVGPGPGKRGKPLVPASPHELTTISSPVFGRQRIRQPSPLPPMRSDDRYRSWKMMRKKCNETENTHVSEWNDFWVFAQDLGKRPPGTVLLRHDMSVPYSTKNCFWGTKAQASRGRRFVRRYRYNGREMTIPEIAQARGIKPKTLDARLRKGLPLEEALNPVVRPGPGRPRR